VAVLSTRLKLRWWIALLVKLALATLRELRAYKASA
jgi:hypothetical protein